MARLLQPCPGSRWKPFPASCGSHEELQGLGRLLVPPEQPRSPARGCQRCCFSWGCRILEFTSPCSASTSLSLNSTFPRSPATSAFLPYVAFFSSPVENTEWFGVEGTLQLILVHPLYPTLILCLISSHFSSSCVSD